jgi:hypothetical protein
MMTTKAQYLTQIKTENPTMTKSVNGENIVLDADEYEATCEAWATMKTEQDAHIKAEADKASARQAVLDRLGITADEAALLLG